MPGRYPTVTLCAKATDAVPYPRAVLARRTNIGYAERRAEMRRRTGSRSWLRVLLGSTYLIGAASVAIIFSIDPGQNTREMRWGLRLLLFGCGLALVTTVFLIVRLGSSYLRLLLPWYGVPYLAWLIGGPPRGEGRFAATAYAWCLAGTLAFLITIWATARP
jgi:hypothetical protein